MCINKPRSRDRAYDSKTSRIKVEITQVVSIVDTGFKQKSTTKMTSHKSRNRVRLHGKKAGKTSSKIRSND